MKQFHFKNCSRGAVSRAAQLVSLITYDPDVQEVFIKSQIIRALSAPSG